MLPNSLPDNLKSRLRRLYVDSRSFKNDAGEKVAYERLVLEFSIKGKPYPVEFKLDAKDRVVLPLTDTESEAQAISVASE